MIDLGDRRIMDDGTVICTQDAMMELLYSGRTLRGVLCADPEDQREWELAAREHDSTMPGPMFHDGVLQDETDWFQYWMTPEPWASMDLREWCLARCTNQRESQRVDEEMLEFESREMLPVLRHLAYCASIWREHGIVWGVGRGSSVCSLVLYLIGINRINPIEHGLEMDEWLK